MLEGLSTLFVFANNRNNTNKFQNINDKEIINFDIYFFFQAALDPIDSKMN